MEELLDGQTTEWWEEKSKKWTPGSNIEEAIECIKSYNNSDYRVVLNSIADESKNDEESLKNKANYISIISKIKENGVNAGITVRLSNIGLGYSYDKSKLALKEILEESRKNEVNIEVDMEERKFVENTIKMASEMLEEGYSLKLCLQSAVKDTYGQFKRLKDNENISFRIVTGSCYPDTCELNEVETIKQFYKILLEFDEKSAIGTHILERLLCSKSKNVETQVLMGFESKFPAEAVDTIYACFGDWKTNSGIRGYILRREQC